MRRPSTLVLLSTAALMWAACFGACDASTPEAPPPVETPTAGAATLLAGHPGAGTLSPDGTAPRVIGVTALTTCPGTPDRVYVVDTFGTAIYELSVSSGETRLLAGAPGVPALADGPPASARFASPRGIACVPSGDALIVADSGAFRRIALPSGDVATVAGFPGTPGFTDGDATTARIGYLIHAMVATPAGDAMIFSDRSASSLRRLDLGDLSVTTLAGRGAGLDGPGGLAFSEGAAPTLYVADTFNDRIVEVNSETGSVREVVSTPSPQGLAIRGGHMVAGGFDGPLVAIDLATWTPRSVDAAWSGIFASPIFAGENSSQLVVAPLGTDSVVAFDLADDATEATATTLLGPDPEGATAPGATPLLDWHPGRVSAVVAAPGGETLFALDAALGLLARVDLLNGVVSTVPLDAVPRDDVDAVPLALEGPSGLAISSDGTQLAVADAGAGAVYLLVLDAGLNPISGRRLGGPMRAPTGLAFAPAHEAPRPEADSHLYIAETGGHRVLRVDLRAPEAGVEVVAGTGQAGYLDGPPGVAQLLAPRALLVDPARGRVLIGEEDGRALRVLARNPGSTTYAVSTWIAPPEDPETLPADGPPAAAVLGTVAALAAPDPSTVIIADGAAYTLRALRLSADGLPGALETIAGRQGAPGGVTRGASAPLNASLFGAIGGLAVGADGNLLVATDAAILRLDATAEGW